jgi:hypothetical protein
VFHEAEKLDALAIRSPRPSMKGPPHSIIHINFVGGPLLFDARPIWTALREAEAQGKLAAPLATDISARFGNTAIYLGTRHYLMKRAIEELKGSLLEIFNLVEDSWKPPGTNYRVIDERKGGQARDRVLLFVDSFLWEFRSFLELLAKFAYGILVQIGKGPARMETLSSGSTVEITSRRGRFKPHGFLLYLCDKLQIQTSWYTFLSLHRNLFSHEAAPYCAIEALPVRPPEFDLIIMRTNIQDFRAADPSDYFRVSEFQGIVNGTRSLSTAVQQYLINAIEN